ncbi:MAG: extracellular solute-binding protein [Treponema sp.]|jgi:multiple sugar transport system substrate-binding protein|nr:extracellular solute-binding protein [Treponema sp.]
MSKQFNRALVIILFSGLVLLVVGLAVRLVRSLSTSTTTNSLSETMLAPTSSKKSKVKLVFSQWWQNELEVNTLQTLIADFEKGYPNISISLDTHSYTEIEGLTLTATPLSVDIIGIDPRWFYELVRYNQLESLTSYREAQAQGETSLFSITDTDHQYGDWGVQLVSFMAPLFYNINVLQKAGFDRPPKTWSEIFSYAKAISRPAENRFGLAFALSPDYPQGITLDIYSWIWASGGTVLRNGRPNFTDGTVVDSLSFLKSLLENKLLSPDSFSKTRQQKLDEFASGRIGLMISPAQDIEVLRQRIGEAGFGVTTLPVSDTYMGKSMIGLSHWYACISSYSQHKSEAWAFLSFLSSRAKTLADAAHAVPGAGVYPRDDALYAKAYDIYENAEVTSELIGLPRTHTLETIVWEEVKNMFEGYQDASTTAQMLQTRWESMGL